MSSGEDPVAWLRRQVEGDAAWSAPGGQRLDSVVRSGDFSINDMRWVRHAAERLEADRRMKLAILEAHNQAEHYCPIPVLPGRHGQLWTPEEGPCWTLRLLASAYRHHAGYAEHWGGQG